MYASRKEGAKCIFPGKCNIYYGIPKSEQNTPEVEEAKAKEMKNLEDYGVF